MSEQPKTAREAALKILYKVVEEGAYANLELSQTLVKGSYSPQDAGLITHLVYGVLRYQGALDYYINRLLRNPKEKLPTYILLILRLSLYQIIYLDKIPPSAAVNEGVKLAKIYGHKGTSGLVNGVLRNYLRKQDSFSFPLEDDKAGYLTYTLSHPVWLSQYLAQSYTFDDITAFYQWNNSHDHFTLRTNTLKTNRQYLLAEINAMGIDAKEGLLTPEAIVVKGMRNLSQWPLFKKGYFAVEDQSSQLVAYALNPAKGSRVLDICAAPGGKTTHLAQIMADDGEIRAFDLHPHKIKLIEDNCRRLGIKSVKAQAADSINLPEEFTRVTSAFARTIPPLVLTSTV